MFEEMKKDVKVSEHNYRYIGKHGNRADADDLVSGRSKFIDDLVMPGMLILRVLRSPYPNCMIKSINVDKARALPGVVGVCTCKEAPDWKCGLPNHRRVLDQHLRFVGNSVALVAAETIEIADEALDLIEVEYEELPFVLDCEEALKPGTPQLYPEYPGNEIPKVTPFSEEPFNQIFVGDPKEGFKESKYVASNYMKYENMAHPLPPESPGCIAQWTGPHAVTVWYNGGAPHLQKFNTEASIPGVAVRVIACQAGGSYGSKQLIPHMILQARSRSPRGRGRCRT
ncbi:MAG: molybdopterin cofactor-binding domain-containing protein [Eubacteriales bacterium]|nr:molybdopterin cofactor-binding domain-containing protein [Eubacteriales bacterium]